MARQSKCSSTLRRPAAAILEGGYHDDLPLLIDAFLTAWDHAARKPA